MASDAPALTADDLALLDRVAARVVELRLEVPAVLTLESVRPLSVVAGQALVFFQPLVQSFLRFGDYRRFAGLAGRREALEALTVAIERRADEAATVRRARRKGAAPADRGTPPANPGGGRAP